MNGLGSCSLRAVGGCLGPGNSARSFNGPGTAEARPEGGFDECLAVALELDDLGRDAAHLL